MPPVLRVIVVVALLSPVAAIALHESRRDVPCAEPDAAGVDPGALPKPTEEGTVSVACVAQRSRVPQDQVVLLTLTVRALPGTVLAWENADAVEIAPGSFSMDREARVVRAASLPSGMWTGAYLVDSGSAEPRLYLARERVSIPIVVTTPEGSRAHDIHFLALPDFVRAELWVREKCETIREEEPRRSWSPVTTGASPEGSFAVTFTGKPWDAAIENSICPSILLKGSYEGLWRFEIRDHDA
ncbi:MAG TPA: hypothetical protein VM889_04690 [Candidatus Thermoplasmatota archaeon]|nr:hypothetical protein [Candidatus Thermoplasmatota archaeon]